MAVTITGVRNHISNSQSESRAFITYSISGTYVTGGFITPYALVPSMNPGSSPTQSRVPIKFDWDSPLGYIYHSTIVIPTTAPYLPVVTTKIFSAANTELANAAAMPDAVIICGVDATKY